MLIRTLGYAAAAGIATFLVVFVVVSEALLPYIEFSVLVGIPAGLFVGVLVAAFVLTQLGKEDDRTRRAIAYALSAFGVTLLIVFVLAITLQTGATISLLAATIVGVIVGIGIFLRHTR